MRMRKKILVLSIVFAVAFTSSVSAKTWTGANSDDWLDVLNWDDGVPPEGPLTSGTTFGSPVADVVMSATATFQPVANSGETIGATVTNNFGAVAGSISLLTFESGSFGDFFNFSGAFQDETGDISYDIQAGAVVSVINEVDQFNGPGTITLGGLLQAIGDGNFVGHYAHNGGANRFLDVLAGGLMTVQGDDTTALDGHIANGFIFSSSPGYHVESSYDGGSNTTSVFAVIPEPTSLTLLGFAGLTMAMFRRRKGSS